ncbi:MAG TPA: hypothetical protein VF405_10945 [Gammaproteobacteria bacterium]
MINALTRTVTLGLAALAPMLVPSAGEAAEWKYSLGIHNMVVSDVDSTTWGVGGRAEVDDVTEAGKHRYATFDVYLDHDEDHLDPDHIPVWWETNLGIDNEFWQGSRSLYLGWVVEFDSRMNTVSSVERQVHLLPAARFGFAGNAVQASLEAGIGYNFLEIDDDAPRLRGYDRTNLRETTSADAVAADVAFRVGKSWEVFGHTEQWHDSDNEWIQTQFVAGFDVAAERWGKGSQIGFSVETNEYNLDRYSTPGLPPVLAWDDDLFYKLDFRFVRPMSRASN